jgi:hypothetical protein
MRGAAMDAAPKGSRLTPIRIGAALVVAAALSIGATACGSDSSSESTGSAAVVEKEAGLFTKGARVTVVNKDSAGIKVTMCGDGGCKAAVELKAVGDWDVMSGEDVSGSVRYADGYTVDFTAGNPDVGAPWIKLTAPPAGNGMCCETTTFRLFEGERLYTSGPTSPGGYPFVADRTADSSDYKEMTLNAYGNGGLLEPCKDYSGSCRPVG